MKCVCVCCDVQLEERDREREGATSGGLILEQSSRGAAVEVKDTKSW